MSTKQVEDLLREYLKFKSLADDTKSRVDAIKNEITELVDRLGYEDDRGHRWLELDDAVGEYVSIQRQKRIIKSLDEESAEQILTDLGLRDRCLKTVEVLDEDAIMAALYEGLLTDQHIDQMFPSKVVWAFIPSKK